MLERSSVIPSLSRALLGEVTPSLRAVQFGLPDRTMDILCIFNGDLSRDDSGSISRVATDVMADFPDAPVQEHCLRIDLPGLVPYPPGRYTVFARKV